MSSSAPKAVKMAGDYEKVKLLGSGSYGKAWLVACRSKKRQAVLKEIKLDSLSDKEIGQALVEVKVLAKCHHVNIISYCEAFESACCLNIVMEYADSGDLQKKILDQRGIHFHSETILDWFIQICFALKYLHSQNILHRDLKPQNLFLTSDNVVKVGDFGIARILQDSGDHAVTAIGTPYYLSPEICQRQLYNSKSDMWSAGCVLYELCCLRVPFQAPNLPLLVLAILQGDYHPIPSHYGAVLEDLISVLLKTDPSQRPTSYQVLSVPALKVKVKATYTQCLGHKQRRRQHRLLSREPDPPPIFSPRGVDKSPCHHRTFSVKSPLVRRLSVATPKLKVAIKRQRSVQSAEAAPTGKRHRQGSRAPPVFNLQEAVLGVCPPRPNGPSPTPRRSPCAGSLPHTPASRDPPHRDPTPHTRGVSHTPAKDTSSHGPQQSCAELSSPDWHKSSDCDDVFEEDDNVPLRNGASKFSSAFPTDDSCAGNGESPCTGLDHSGSEIETADTIPSAFYSPTPCRKTTRGNSIAASPEPESEVMCKAEVGKDSPTFPQNPCTLVEARQRGASTVTAPGCVEGNNGGAGSVKQRPDLKRVQSPRRHRSLTSDTYTVVAAEGRGRCGDGREPQRLCAGCGDRRDPQRCVRQALYTATALSYRNKAAAQRSLSQFLIAHLGSELSLHLCSLVNAALHAGEDYKMLETRLDGDWESYVPAVFHLLSWSEEVVAGT